jgi:hypothetical protein
VPDEGKMSEDTKTVFDKEEDEDRAEVVDDVSASAEDEDELGLEYDGTDQDFEAICFMTLAL